MAQTFFDQPILNSPYAVPTKHHALDPDGQPLDHPPVEGRRRSELITPVPKPKKRKGRAVEPTLAFGDATGLSTAEQEYNPTPIINEIREHVASWRALPNAADWGVTPTTARLLNHWRHYNFNGVIPFFCQVEAVETAIWLTEVARNQKQYAKFWAHIRGANEQANPELMRIAMKMATGSGKTTVMAMLIAWQTLNAIRSPTSNLFSKGFLIITPGITIKDRLRVLQPEDPDSYYRERELVPADLLVDMGKAKIVITNFHVFKHRETLEISKTGRSLLQGRGDAPRTLQTDGEMLRDACGELLALKNVVVINDEAHHCYREKPEDDEEELKGEDKDEAKKNNDAARLWISGIEILKQKIGVRAVYDLSATPFFLRGSGYAEGTLFPWTVSDFSLMDAIECGIVKLPRVPVADNLPGGDIPVYRDLWNYVGKFMPKSGRAKAGKLNPFELRKELQTALYALYSHYKKTYELWKQQGIETPPVFIVVCNNTASSQLVYEWISGWDREENDERRTIHYGHLDLFRNYDQYGNRLVRPVTLLIDSQQLESGEALEPDFRDMAKAEIDQFKREMVERGASQTEANKITDQELLREVMNTVGKKGRLGENIRCVVSVSMLTEGWDTNTVTHIMGVRAFGTQLLCEQVVGRGLRRQSYELNEEGLFDVEYADIMGIPFDFTAKPVVAPPKPPKFTVRVHAVKEREKALEIVFPRVEGYRVDMPNERLTASFTTDSRLLIDPKLVGPCKVLLEGIVGEGVEMDPRDALASIRPSSISFHLAKHLMQTRFRDHDEALPVHLFGSIQRVCRQWIDGGYLVCEGNTTPAMVTYLEIADLAAERIYLACQRGIEGKKRIKAILDPYNPRGSSKHVSFNTSKNLYRTDPRKSHINYVVCDSDWEAELARVLESHPRVLAYVKNQGMQFEVPYRVGSTPRRYVPDFIVRLDDGKGGQLNLVLETKGYRGDDAQMKAETMKTLWIPGINNLGSIGQWQFEEFTEVFKIEEAFRRLVEGVGGSKATE